MPPSDRLMTSSRTPSTSSASMLTAPKSLSNTRYPQAVIAIKDAVEQRRFFGAEKPGGGSVQTYKAIRRRPLDMARQRFIAFREITVIQFISVTGRTGR